LSAQGPGDRLIELAGGNPGYMQLRKILGPSSTRALLVSENVLILTCYIVSTYLLIAVDPTVFLLYNGGLVRILIVSGVIVAGFYLQDMYESVQVRSTVLLVQQVCLGLGLAFFSQAILNYADSTLVFPRWVMLTGSLLILVFVPLERRAFSAVIVSGSSADRVLFLGCSPLIEPLLKKFELRPELGMMALGFVGDAREEEGCAGLVRMGPASRFLELVKQHRPDRIVVALEERRERMPQAELLEVKFSGIEVEEIASTYEAAMERISLWQLRPSQLIFSSELGPRPHTLQIQAIYSRLVALAGLVLASPLAVAAAVLIKLTSRGPIFYRQERTGLNGRTFHVYKFRSMRVDAETGTGAVWAQKNDPRVTPVGRWLRRFRIDELPQLFNVLRGDMAIVGPRPERPEFVEELVKQIPFYRQRLVVKPGITGWAQINHKYGDSLEDTYTKLEYDLYYVKNLSLVLDTYVMFHTFKVIILGRGAQ